MLVRENPKRTYFAKETLDFQLCCIYNEKWLSFFMMWFLRLLSDTFSQQALYSPAREEKRRRQSPPHAGAWIETSI
jgi:hypothetical protein